MDFLAECNGMSTFPDQNREKILVSRDEKTFWREACGEYAKVHEKAFTRVYTL